MSFTTLILAILTLCAAAAGGLLKLCVEKWPDKRTTLNQRLRVASWLVVGAGIVMTAVYGIRDLVERYQSAQSSAFQMKAIQQSTSGALTPDVTVELYTGPNHPRQQFIRFDPEFPGSVAILLNNTNDHPIFDMTASLHHFKSNGTISSKIMREFNETKVDVPILKALEGRVFVYASDIEIPRTTFEVNVRTRRGITLHVWDFELVSNRWEYARTVKDVLNSNVLAFECSTKYPRKQKQK